MRNHYHEIMKNQQRGGVGAWTLLLIRHLWKDMVPSPHPPTSQRAAGVLFPSIEAHGDNPHEESETLAV